MSVLTTAIFMSGFIGESFINEKRTDSENEKINELKCANCQQVKFVVMIVALK